MQHKKLSLNWDELSREQLIELVKISAKNNMAMDGYWFQSIESNDGMDKAMEHDEKVWKNFGKTEALRIKNFLKLDEHPGIDGLKRALALRYNSLLHTTDYIETDNSLEFRVIDCRVQMARKNKGMPFHPCLSAGIVEYTHFAQTIDSRFKVSTISCFPEITDDSCCCAWRFEL